MHKNDPSGIPLTTMEIQGLQLICESFIHNNDFTIISNVFQKLAIIESSLGSNDDLAFELKQLRIDFSRVYWFKQLCIANIDNVYDRFVKGAKKQNNNKEVKKLMIEIVRSGLGNISYDNNIMNGHSSSLCFKNLEKIFSAVNLWNIQKSRIEFFTCMDQIMLLDSSSNGSLHSNDGDLVMGGSDEDFDNLKSRVIDYFWEELVLKGNNDCLIVSHIIRGIREDVAVELFEHGLIILEKYGELIVGIEEVFRALLLSVRDSKKLEFSEALITQVQKISDENKDHTTFVSCIMTRIKLFVLVASVLAARVTAVVTTNSIEFANRQPDYNIIMKWVVMLIKLLCNERIHQNGSGADNFDLILDLVSFLLDEMGKIPRAIIVAELKNKYHFNIPVIWSNRIKRVLPLNIPKETLGKRKHGLDAWQLIEGIGENDDLNNSAIDLSWYDAKFYQKPSKRLKRSDEYEDYNLDFNKKYNEENGHLEP
ncbi:hypothetical protein GLOIN_2v1698364 [Rhizophagus clarus]|uniref:Uncharacterized protein n=1 Tax=Rhizophagus clarus TaxID=94130 RepID=A0A8H3LGB8_9GLOM|nr:hypothetical protein GLOIN_2v1698364 [Rhizophagus clarus]